MEPLATGNLTLARRHPILALLVSIGVCFAAAQIGNLLARPALEGNWYEQLAKPPWNPPRWVFPVVWSILYAAMAVAAWLVWLRRPLASLPLAAFVIQLLLNVAWSAFFFGLRQPWWALADLLLLWLAIAATMLFFWRPSRQAAVLMAAYLAWVSYAGTLNLAICLLN